MLAVLWWGGWGAYFVSTGAFHAPAAWEKAPIVGSPLDSALQALRNADKVGAVEDAKRLAKIADRLFRAQKRSRPLNMWPAAVVPPFAVFVVGWVVAWVLKGFRQGKG